jgi:hypothetical protein
MKKFFLIALIFSIILVSGCTQSAGDVPDEFYCSADGECAPCSNSECANANYLEVADCPGDRCGTYIKECKCIGNACTAITGNYFIDTGQPMRSGC